MLFVSKGTFYQVAESKGGISSVIVQPGDSPVERVFTLSLPTDKRELFSNRRKNTGRSIAFCIGVNEGEPCNLTRVGKKGVIDIKASGERILNKSDSGFLDGWGEGGRGAGLGRRKGDLLARGHEDF